MKLIIASNNAHKLIEMKAILGEYFDEIYSLREAGIDHETIEDGTTFLENAEKKAREIAEISGCCAIADDSGICADALDGAPGIYSARFCGHHGDDEANNDKVLALLADVPEEDRGAKFCSAIVLCYPDGSYVSGYGETYGKILPERQGTQGFGYDPLFFNVDLNKSFGIASAEEKNTVSHRYRALMDLKGKL